MLTGLATAFVLLQRTQPMDHRLDPRTRLLVLGHQVGTLGHQLLLARAQAAVLLAQALAQRDQLVDALGDLVQFLAGGRLGGHEPEAKARQGLGSISRHSA
jgi:hypothetical protein